MPSASPQPKFYFVSQCGAQFFHTEETAECPRCGEKLTSREKLVPPWKVERSLTVAELSHRLHLSEAKIYELCAGEEMPHHKFGAAIRFEETDVQEYLESTKRGRKSAPSWQAKTDPRPRNVKRADWF